MITAKKLKLLHVGRRELKLTEEAYREILRHHGGVESSKDLDDPGFKRVIDCLKALGFWVKRKFEQTRPRNAGDLPTPGQLKVIEHLWADLAEYVAGADQAAFRRGFYRERLKIPALGPQTRKQANAVIEVLKRRVHSEMKKTVGTAQPLASQKACHHPLADDSDRPS